MHKSDPVLLRESCFCHLHMTMQEWTWRCACMQALFYMTTTYVSPRWQYFSTNLILVASLDLWLLSVRCGKLADKSLWGFSQCGLTCWLCTGQCSVCWWQLLWFWKCSSPDMRKGLGLLSYFKKYIVRRIFRGIFSWNGQWITW